MIIRELFIIHLISTSWMSIKVVLVKYIYFYTHKDNWSCISKFSILPPLKTFSHVQIFRTHFFEPINLVFLAIYRLNPHIFTFFSNNHNSWQSFFSPFLGNINKIHHFTFYKTISFLHIRNPDMSIKPEIHDFV